MEPFPNFLDHGRGPPFCGSARGGRGHSPKTLRFTAFCVYSGGRVPGVYMKQERCRVQQAPRAMFAKMKLLWLPLWSGVCRLAVMG